MMFLICKWSRYADEFAAYCSFNFNKFRPYATFGADDFVLLSKDDVFRRVVKGENDSNHKDYSYPKYKPENEMFQWHAAYATSVVLDPYECSSIGEDGRVIEHTIAYTSFSENMVSREPGHVLPDNPPSIQEWRQIQRARTDHQPYLQDPVSA
jgi:hypothetical protein